MSSFDEVEPALDKAGDFVLANLSWILPVALWAVIIYVLVVYVGGFLLVVWIAAGPAAQHEMATWFGYIALVLLAVLLVRRVSKFFFPELPPYPRVGGQFNNLQPPFVYRDDPFEARRDRRYQTDSCIGALKLNRLPPPEERP
jgi:hypothetical protein